MVWARDRGRERHTEDEGIFLSLSDTRKGKGGFPEALETWGMTCWAPVCVLISICDCIQIQGGRHSGILRRPPGLADWGCLSAGWLRYSVLCLPVPCVYPRRRSQGQLWLLVQQLFKEGRRGIVHRWSHSKLSWTRASVSWGSRLHISLGRVPHAFEWVMLFNRGKGNLVSFCSFNASLWEWWGLHYFAC